MADRPTGRAHSSRSPTPKRRRRRLRRPRRPPHPRSAMPLPWQPRPPTLRLAAATAGRRRRQRQSRLRPAQQGPRRSAHQSLPLSGRGASPRRAATVARGWVATELAQGWNGRYRGCRPSRMTTSAGTPASCYSAPSTSGTGPPRPEHTCVLRMCFLLPGGTHATRIHTICTSSGVKVLSSTSRPPARFGLQRSPPRARDREVRGFLSKG